MSRAVDYLPDEFTKQATEDKLLHHGKKEKLLSFLGTCDLPPGLATTFS